MVRDAACAGMGVAMLPYSMIIRDEAEGRLVDWGRVDGRETELWVLYKSKRLVSRKIVVFIDELFKKFPLGTLRNWRECSKSETGSRQYQPFKNQIVLIFTHHSLVDGA
jgi:hypothetical protein